MNDQPKRCTLCGEEFRLFEQPEYRSSDGKPIHKPGQGCRKGQASSDEQEPSATAHRPQSSDTTNRDMEDE